MVAWRVRRLARARDVEGGATESARELLRRFGWPTARTPTRTASPTASSSGWRSCARSPRGQPALLLDEITSALDPELVGEVLEVVREL